MKGFSVKIAGAVVLVVAVIIAIIAFWPAQTRMAQSPEKRQKQKEQKGRFKAKQRPAVITQEELKHAEKLYRLALLYKRSGSLPSLSYRKTIDCCTKIIQRYPSSPQAEKARKLLAGMPQQYSKQIIADYKQRAFAATETSEIGPAEQESTDGGKPSEITFDVPNWYVLKPTNIDKELEYPNRAKLTDPRELQAIAPFVPREQYNPHSKKMAPAYLDGSRVKKAQKGPRKIPKKTNDSD